MNTIKYFIITCIAVMPILWGGCMEELGSEELDYSRVDKFIIDTTSYDQRGLNSVSSWNAGTVINISPRVKYAHPERLTYRWLMFAANYGPVQSGNAEVFLPADTIGKTRELNYTIGEERAGKRYQLYWVVKDTVSGVSESYQMIYNINVAELGFVGGIYCLQEKDGKTDIDILGSQVYSMAWPPAFSVTRDYWTSIHPEDPLMGKPRMIHYTTSPSRSCNLYIFTDETGMRCYKAGLTKMDSWEEMFYAAPVYNPQAIASVNECDFLINDGKLHCLYVEKAGDRRFGAPVGGNYNLAPWLATETQPSYGLEEGALAATQIVFDKTSNGFKAFYDSGSALQPFKAAASAAVFDVNRMEGELVYTASANVSDDGTGETVAVMKRDGQYWLDIASFYNVVDDGYLAKRSVDLKEYCPDIVKADFFFADRKLALLFYAVGSRLYAWGYNTENTAHVLWEGAGGDAITCAMGTADIFVGVLHFAVWNEIAQSGKVVEIEVDAITGEKVPLVGFGDGGTSWMASQFVEKNPMVYEGFGKIASMTAIMY